VNTQVVLLAAVLGMGAGSGVWLVVDGLTRRHRPQPTTTPTGDGRRWRQLATGTTRVRLVAAVAAAATVGLWTGWPVAAALAAAATWSVPPLLAGTRSRRWELRRLEAVATWTRSLQGALRAGAGLEHALTVTAGTAPEPIRAEASGLAAAIRAGVRLPEALDAFADDLDHPDGDRVVAALRLAATGRARHLADQLAVLADAASDQAAARLRVDAQWATTRTSVRLIVAATLVMIVGQLVLNRGFLDPYNTPAGQLVLAIAGGMWAIGFAWLTRLAQIRPMPRVLGARHQPKQEVRP
jgi:Flp pilus assembly protein TadB